MAADSHVGRDGLFEKLNELGIETTTVEHPEVFTVEEMMPHVQHLPGAKCKNLFLYDKKKKGLWLLTARHDVDVKLGDVSKKVSAPGGLRFADEAKLIDKLGVTQGCVTPFALINDKNSDVRFLIDEALFNGGHERLYFHPLVNSATTGISPDDLKKFLAAVGHEPTVVNLDS